MNDDESHELVEVSIAARESEADVVVSYLQANGIDAFSSTRLPGSVYPNVADGVRVLVNAADAGEARALLAELPEATEEESEESTEE